MTMYRALLCAIDFSDHSRHALRLAAGLADRSAAVLIAFHAIEPLLAEAATERYGGLRLLRDDAARELTAILAADVKPTVRAEAIVGVGPAGDAILACAAERRVDLIVMGSQGLGGVRKAFFGSITERVLRASPLPVLAVNAASAATADFPTGVVAAVDFDALGARVLERAAAFAAEFRIPLTLAHVVPPVQALPQYTDAIEAAQAARHEAAKTRIEEQAASLALTVPVDTEIRTGAVADELAAMMQRRTGEILAIGSGNARILHRPGSTAYRVLCLSLAPVLTVPPEHHATHAHEG